MSKKYTLAAVILARNAQDKIGNTIASVKGWADEILVIDGQSTDRTQEIAKTLGAQVLSHPFLGSFAEERNFGAQEARSEWILQLDSDEIVGEEFKARCDEILPTTLCRAFKFKRKNFFLGRPLTYGGWYHWSQHLYRKDFARYEGRIHERMIVNGDVGAIDADILHYPFDSIAQFIARQNRYTDLQAQDIIETEKDLTYKHVRYNLSIKPFKLFKKMFLKKKGYKEGIYGFIFAVLFAHVHFLKWVKVWEKLYKDNANR